MSRYKKLELPEKAQLETLYKAGNSYIKIGELFLVSGSMIRKWCHHYGIKPRPAGAPLNNKNNFIGDRATYKAYHVRVKAQRGAPMCCSRCGRTDSLIVYEWANLTGRYEDVNDYERMCRSCHRKYDKIKNLPDTSKLVLNLETGIYYESMTQAALALNVNHHTLRDRIHKYQHKTSCILV